ncbi:MAG: CHRD domain-containing protein [Thermoanaerobaculum sp.]
MKKQLLLALIFLAATTLGAQTLTVSLSANQVVGGGQSGASGFATLEFQGTTLSYTILTNGLSQPTGAALYSGYPGQTGSMQLDLAANFVSNLATGTISNVPAAQVAAMLANPSGYYLQVATAASPNGAIRGQLQGEALHGRTVLVAPVLSKVAGQVGTNFLSDLALANFSDQELTVTVRYFPSTGAGAQSAQVVLPARGQKVVNDALTALFAASGRGGAILEAPAAFAGQVRVFNDQRGSTSFPLPGTFSQFFSLTSLGDLPTSGVLVGLSNQPAATGQGFRCNVGYFNPHDSAVTVHLAAYSSDNQLLAAKSVVLSPKANDIKSISDLFGATLSTQTEFFVRFTVSGGSAVVFASVVDNITGDAVTIWPQS